MLARDVDPLQAAGSENIWSKNIVLEKQSVGDYLTWWL